MGTLANLISGVGVVYTAAFGTTKIDATDLTPPAVTVTPSGSWTATGFTRDGVKAVYEPAVEQVFVDQHNGPVDWDLVAETMKISFMIAETDTTAWEIAIAASTATTVSAAADVTARSLLKVGDDTATPISLSLVGYSPTALADSLFTFHRVLQVGSPEMLFKKTQEGIMVEFDVGCDVSQSAGERFFVREDITAVASS